MALNTVEEQTKNPPAEELGEMAPKKLEEVCNTPAENHDTELTLSLECPGVAHSAWDRVMSECKEKNVLAWWDVLVPDALECYESWSQQQQPFAIGLEFDELPSDDISCNALQAGEPKTEKKDSSAAKKPQQHQQEKKATTPAANSTLSKVIDNKLEVFCIQTSTIWKMMMIMFLFVLMASADSNCKIGEDFKCPAVSNKEITVEYGTSALIGIIYNGEITDYKVTLTLYESTDNGLVPYHCCVFPWGNTSCSGCPRLHFEKKGNDTNIILGDVGRGTTFNLTTEGINSFHNFHGAVLVESVPSDEEAPVITCSDNITVETSFGKSSAIAHWIDPSALDNSGQVTVMTDLLPGDSFPIGIHKVTGTAVDGSGNVAQCTFFVIVQDLEPPVLSCPSDITAELTSDPVTWKATAVDNSGAITSVTSIPSASDLVLGINNVTVTAVDPSGNRAECIFTVNRTAPSPDDKGSVREHKVLLGFLWPFSLIGVCSVICFVIWGVHLCIKNKACKKSKKYHRANAKATNDKNGFELHSV